MSILIDILLETIREEFKHPPPPFQLVPLEQSDLAFLHRECNQDSEFDPTNKRRAMYENLVEGKVPAVIAKCAYGQIAAVLDTAEQEQSKEIPWDLWARILRLYTEPKKKQKTQKPFKVYFLANPNKRQFPPGKKAITPENINGGYTYPCERDTILIYRAEDATRVLLHELMHSCCLDHHELGVDQVEAETEAWAELVYIALLSEGDPVVFRELLSRQSQWMVAQNEEVIQHMKRKPSSKGPKINGSEGDKEFPWRYTLGKEEVWRRWGLIPSEAMNSSSSSNHTGSSTTRKASASSGKADPRRSMKNEAKKKSAANPRKSLRLTFPVDKTLKKRFHVKESSTIL